MIEQIAADQLPRGDDNRPLAALGFLTVGRRFLLDQNEIIDDRIDVVTRGLLGLTVTCARCHDHKFDPIPTEDYYSLYGVFASSVEPAELPLLGRPGDPARSADYHRKLAAATQARDQYLAARRDEFVADLQTRLSEYLKAARLLRFDPENSELDERGLAGNLNTRRLRSLITMWKRYLEATSKVDDPVVGPWNAFAGLPTDQFAAKSSEVQRKLTGPNDAKAPPIHPLVARSVIGSPPATWTRSSNGIRLFSPSSRRAGKSIPRSRPPRRPSPSPIGSLSGRRSLAAADRSGYRRTPCGSFSIKNKPVSSIS